MDIFKKNIAETISAKFEDLKFENIIDSLEKPKNPEFGDTALPCFKFAKTFRKPPVKIADELSELFLGNDLFENVVNVNGYLNFKFSKEKFIKSILQDFSDDTFFANIKKGGEGKVLGIDFSSPNIAKEFHVGHLRASAVGNAVQKIYRENGWKVWRINHLGDWGTQFGKLMAAYKKWGVREELIKAPIRYLQKLYVKFHTEAKLTPALEDEGRNWFVMLENGDDEAVKMWKEFRKYAIESLEKAYHRLGVEFDHYWGEAFYEQHSKKVAADIEKKGVGKYSEGALIVEFEDDMPPCLVKKSDGSTLYATRDIAAAIHRKSELNFNKFIYVTEMKQQLHFKQVFRTIKKLGYKWTDELSHIYFGSILGLSTRKGNVVYLQDLLDEAASRALKTIEEKNADLENKEDIAEKIGIGAVVFQEMYKSRVKDTEFSWDRALSFEGETGPYVQYTYVRIHNILNKIENPADKDIDYSLLTDDESYSVVTLLSEYGKKLKVAKEEAEPSIMASYLIELAKAFNRFYRVNRVIGVDEPTSQARIFLLKALSEVYLKCMDIVGVPVVNNM